MAADRRHAVKTLPHVGDVVAFNFGGPIVRARVIETYTSAIGPRITVEVPAEPDPEVESTTFSLKLDDLEPVAA